MSELNIGRRIVASVAATATVLTLAGCSFGSRNGPEGSQSDGAPAATATPYPADACPPPSSEDIAAVEKLLRQPRADVVIDMHTTDPYDYLAYQVQDRFERYETKLAKRLGTKVLDTEDLQYKMIQQTTYAHDPENPDPRGVSFETILKEGNEAVEKLGFRIDTVNKKEDPDIDKDSRPTKDELEDWGDKAVRGLLAEIDGLPKSTIKASGLKRVVFVKSGNSGFIGPNGTMYLNIYNADQGVFRHELAHFLDIAKCQGKNIHKDPDYESLHGDAKIYNLADNKGNLIQEDTKNPSYENKQAKIERLERQGIAAVIKGDKKKVSDIKAKIDKTKGSLLTWENYHPDVIEDKAETGAMILTPGKYDRLDPEQPIIRQKFIYQLARLNRIDPKGTEFLVRTSKPFKERTIESRAKKIMRNRQ